MVGLAFTMGKPHPYRCHIIKMINSCCVHNGERFWCDFSGPVVGGVPCGKGDGSKDGGTSGFRCSVWYGIVWYRIACCIYLYCFVFSWGEWRGNQLFSRVLPERSRRIAKAMCQLGQVAQLPLLSLSLPFSASIWGKMSKIEESRNTRESNPFSSTALIWT